MTDPIRDPGPDLSVENRRFRALLESWASLVFVADAAGELLDVPLAHGIHSDVSQNARGDGWADAVHPDDRADALQAWQRCVAEGIAFHHEFRLRTPEGYRWHIARSARVERTSGTEAEWIGFCVDVHERALRERTLSLIDGLTDLTRQVRDPESIMAAGQKMLGRALAVSRCVYGEPVDGGRRFQGVANYCVDCEDLNGRLPVSGFSSEVSERLRKGQMIVLDDVRQDGAAIDGMAALVAVQIAAMVCVPISKDGHVVAVLAVHEDQPRRWSKGEVEMVRAFADRLWSEIGRARAERDLVASEQRLRRTLEAATVGVVVNDVEGTFTYANPPLLRMLGYAPEDVAQGRLGWRNIQVKERLPDDDRALEQLRESGSCDPYETEFLHREGHRVPVYVGAAFIPNETGDGVLGAAFVTDLSELKAAERDLRTLNAELDERVRARTKELVEANRELEGFTHSVSHDLRAPLRAIVSTSRILLEELGDRLDGDDRALLERQAANAVKLGGIIDDLLQLTRLGREEVTRQEFDLSVLAQSVVRDLMCQEWAQKCRIEIAPEIRAQGDPKLVRFVLLNLMENACKFSPNGGTVRVGQREDGAFFVADEGIGFDITYLDRLFLPFERLVTATAFPGSGIGLANVQRIVQRHGGRVWAESHEGLGSTFLFTLD